MSRFNARQDNTTVNMAGGKAYSHSPEAELVHATLTTFLDDKYYESKGDRIARLVDLVKKSEKSFVAKLAVVARKEFHLRSVAHLLLGELSKVHRGDDLVMRSICTATERVDDLTEIASYLGGKLSKQVKRGIRNAILKFNRYQLAKYKAEGKSISLVDLFNMVHPKVQHATPEQAQAWKDLINGDLKSIDTWESTISNSSEEDKAENWEKLVLENKLGYMALLRNLNNLTKNNVSDIVLDKVIAKLVDEDEIKKSKQLPFRFLTAFENVKGNRLLSDAISEAMDVATANAPIFDGKTLIAVDTSGSMTYGADGGAIRKAAIFAATLLKSNPGAEVVLYDTRVKDIVLSGRTPVIDLAKNIEKEAMGGGTATSVIFKTEKKYDQIIILSDNQSWADQGFGYSYSGDSVGKAFSEYKKRTDADPYVFAVDIQGYGTKDIEGGKVFHVSGWSDRLLDFIGVVKKGESLIDYIKNYEL